MNRAAIRALELPDAKHYGTTYRYLISEMDSGRIIIPDYQRGRVWTQQQAQRFAGFVLTGGKPPPIWTQQHPDEDVEEVVDGLQRITAMRAFFDGAIPAELPNGQCVYRHELAPDCEGLIKGLYITKMVARLRTRADVLKLYLSLNRGGTVHSDAEINRVQEMLRDEEQALSVASP